MSEPTPLGRRCTLWVSRTQARAALVVVAALGLAVVCGLLAFSSLSVSGDARDLFESDAGWLRDYRGYEAAFPHYAGAVLVVIDGPDPDQARRAALRLEEALDADPELGDIYLPTAHAFFRQHALLYLDSEDVQAIARVLQPIAPFLISLERDPDLGRFAAALTQAIRFSGGNLPAQFVEIVKAWDAAVLAESSGGQYRFAWMNLLLGQRAELIGARQVFVVQPAAETGPALERVRALAEQSGITKEAGFDLAFTGEGAFTHEDGLLVDRALVRAGALAMLLIAILLWAALRHVLLTGLALVTLAIALAWTAGWAALAGGELNLVSSAFPVLVVAIGTGFVLQHALRAKRLRGEGMGAAEAFPAAAGEVGPAIVYSALTTALALFAFLPTDFAGVAQLGLVAGGGVLLACLAALVLLPALVALPGVRVLEEVVPSTSRPAARHSLSARSMLAGAALLSALAVFALPGLRFEANPLRHRAPDSASVTAFDSLADSPLTTPYRASVMVASEAEALALQQRIAELPAVDSALTLIDLLPTEQAEKLPAVQRLARAIEAASNAPLASAPALLPMLDAYLAALQGWPAEHAPAWLPDAAERFAAWRATLPSDADAAKAASASMRDRLLSGLPDSLLELRMVLATQGATRDDLPPDLVDRWLDAEGRWRIEVLPRANLGDPQALAEFVDPLLEVAPTATGAPVALRAAGQTAVRAYQFAVLLAAALIAAVLLIVTRSLRDTLAVLLPLVLAGAWVLGLAAVTGLELDFANAIALPLLMGIGVDAGIHVLHARRTHSAAAESGARRAAFWSALVTLAGFGSLAVSGHPGLASAGWLLILGSVCSAAATLVLLPALLGPARAR